MNKKTKTLFSGAQPTGVPHLGNYIGAIKNWVKLQNEYNCFFSVVNMHSITVRQDPVALRKNTRDLLMMYLACGLNLEENIIFYQSHVSAHAELTWILNCYTYLGELSRMTQFKDKSNVNENNLNAGLLTYPVLMAADILLYQVDYVPVGEDQKQHLELTRDLATRFNNIYGDVFKIPEPIIPKTGGRIMGLQNPERKMSKSESENQNNIIYLSDTPNMIINKIKRAVTDSENEIIYSDKIEKAGVKNLLDIYMAITEKTVDESLKEFGNMGYGKLKQGVGEVLVDEIKKIQDKYKELNKNKDYIDKIIKENSDKANYFAEKTLNKVKRKIGFIN